MKLYTIVHKLRGYDIVQLINPMFLELKAECIFPIYQYLRKHNKKVILGGFGMDYYWVSVCCKDKPLRYSDFNIGDKLRTNTDALKERKDWLGTEKGRLNQMIAEDCDGIITGLYEYWACYQLSFPQKTTFIPFPIKPQLITPGNSNSHTYVENHQVIPLDIPKKVKLFIGINKSRSEYKGTDIMLKAAQAIAKKYPDKTELRIAESIPFAEYVKMMNGSDDILDQLYSYTPSMNPLEAMARGIICIGGGSKLTGILDLIARQTGLNVSRGKLPTYITVGDTKATSELLEVTGILYAAAKKYDAECLEMPNHKELPPTGEGNEPDPEEEKEEKVNETAHKTKNKFWEKTKKRITNIFANPEVDDSDLLE